jgi:hypothetical protein
MNNRLKSLEVRNEVIKLIKEKFEMNFSYSYNDLYRVKDDFIVRRLKGGLYNVFDVSKFGYVNINKNKDLRDEFNNLILKIDDYLKHVKKTREDLSKECLPDAEKRAKVQLIHRQLTELHEQRLYRQGIQGR